MMAVAPGKTRIIVTVDADVVKDVRKLLGQLGLRREYLSALISESLKAQRVVLGRLVKEKRKGKHKESGMGAFMSLLFDTVDDLKAAEKKGKL